MIKQLLAALLAFLAISVFAADANTASEAELDAVKGIGPAIATKIIEERKNGSFKDWNDLVTRVKGIGDKSAAKLSAAGLTVNGAAMSGAPAAPAAPAATKTTVPAAATAPTAKPAAPAPAPAPARAPAAKPATTAAAPAAPAASSAKELKKAAAAQKKADKAAAAAQKKADKAAAAASAASASKKK